MAGNNFAPSPRALAQSPKDFGPQRPPAKPDQISPGEDTVLMTFPKPVLLTTDQRKRVFFPAGINRVPLSLADHEYLQDNGVQRYEPAEAAKLPPVPPAGVGPTAVVAEPVDLTAMTKAQLIDHAQEVHGLDLDAADKKDDMIAAIQEAAGKKE